ncbi:GIY-YIG nuclease family protein [Xanthomonas citri pv. citri]|nr:GIY-YIG nuclease family protein [Xanthomonas citri pv. citri]
MSGGYANKVERLLHYLFRDRAMAMPYGDGHTEWFAMDAWNEVLAFLAGQRARLGVGSLSPFPCACVVLHFVWPRSGHQRRWQRLNALLRTTGAR